MKILAASVALVLWTSVIDGSPQAQAPSDAEVLRALLQQAVIPDTIANWALDPKRDSLVVSEQAITCELPAAERERLRQNAALERSAKGENVSQAELKTKTPSKNEDLAVAPGRVIPRSIVAGCLTSLRRPLPRFTTTSPLHLTWETAMVIAKQFRTSDIDQWNRRHPGAAGVLQLSLPVYSDDGSRAGVYVSRLRNGVGGAGVFFMLRYQSEWKIVWQQSVWIE